MDLVTITEEILNGKLHFLCSGTSEGKILAQFKVENVLLAIPALLLILKLKKRG